MEKKSKLPESKNPLHLGINKASMEDNPEIVRLLLTDQKIKKTINDIDSNGMTPLIEATICGNPKIVKLLLDADADVNQETTNDLTALHVAAISGHAEITRQLIEAGAYVNAIESDSERTALYHAAANGHVEIVEVLLEANADISLEDDIDAFTPLHIAAKEGHIAVVNSLLKKLNTYTHIEQWEIINLWSYDRMTPLFLAAQNGHLAIVEALIQSDADINKEDSYGCTPLFIAIMKQHTAMVELLIKHQTNVHLRTQDNQTPLSLAVQNNQVRIIELLLSVGAGLCDKIDTLPKGTRTTDFIVIGLKVNGKTVTRKMLGWEEAITSIDELQDAFKSNVEINTKALMKACNYLLEHRPKHKATLYALQDSLMLQASKKSLLEHCLFEISRSKHVALRAEIYRRKRKLPDELAAKVEEMDMEPMPKKLRFI